MRSYVAVTVIVLAGWTLAACGDSAADAPRAKPVSDFNVFPDSVRAFSDFGAVDSLVKQIELPRDAKHFALQFDCSAEGGSVSVRWKGRDLVTAECSSVGAEGKGIIANELPSHAGTVSLVVNVPAGGTWSAAVDLVR